MNAADTFSFHDGNAHVALFTPAGAPGVLHDPVLLTSSGVCAISNNECGVVKIGTTLGGVEDTALVALENSAVGLNRDGYGLLIDSSLQLGDTVSLDVVIAFSLSGGLGQGGVLAGAISCCVNVVFL
jgi:hypothetical protein